MNRDLEEYAGIVEEMLEDVEHVLSLAVEDKDGIAGECGEKRVMRNLTDRLGVVRFELSRFLSDKEALMADDAPEEPKVVKEGRRVHPSQPGEQLGLGV